MQFRKKSLPVSVHISKSAFCSVQLGCLSQLLSEKLQKLQNRAARVINKSSYDTNSSYLLISLSWDNLSVRRAKQKANLMYKCVNKLAPVYLCNKFTPKFVLWSSIRDATQKLYLPPDRTETKNRLPKAKRQLQRSFTMKRSSRETLYYKILRPLQKKY